jgi:hypothetical protein
MKMNKKFFKFRLPIINNNRHKTTAEPQIMIIIFSLLLLLVGLSSFNSPLILVIAAVEICSFIALESMLFSVKDVTLSVVVFAEVVILAAAVAVDDSFEAVVVVLIFPDVTAFSVTSWLGCVCTSPPD